MRCPFCGFEDTKVIDSRTVDGKKRRRRECGACGKRYTTFETIEKPLLMVIKKDGTFEPFDKTKLMRGILTAIKKRPVNIEQVNHIVEAIENHYANAMENTAYSVDIGNMALQHLRGIDPVAYIRFASVYKDFADVDSFIRAISELEA